MGWKCCVPLCRSGYKSGDPSVHSAESVSFYAFPHDQTLRNKWLSAIKRVDKDKFGNLNDYVPTASSRVCSLHFHHDDFIRESHDTNTTRYAKRPKTDLKILQLKPSAIPRIFKSYPSYLTSTASAYPDVDRGRATASARFEKQEKQMEALASEFLENDRIDNFETLCERLSFLVLPSNYLVMKRSECVLFCCLSEDSFDKDGVPSSQCFVRIYKNMTFDCYINGCRMNSKQFSYLMKVESVISSETEISNLLAKCKSLSYPKEECDLNSLIESAHGLLERFIHLAECNESHSSLLGLINFIAEQLSLCQISEHGRRYSPNLLVTAFLWHMNSRALYARLGDLFCLPSVRRLQQISAGSAVNPSIVDTQYLKMRAANLDENQKIVLLIIDEIYVASRIELVDGRLVGVTDNGGVSKTVLVFMVQSIRSKYKDVVKVVPVDTLTTDLLLEQFHSVLQSISDIFHVFAISVDNHVVNR